MEEKPIFTIFVSPNFGTNEKNLETEIIEKTFPNEKIYRLDLSSQSDFVEFLRQLR